MGKYYISTALRESSAQEGPNKYYETLVWEWDKHSGKLLDLIDTIYAGTEDTPPFEAIWNHYKAILNIIRNGKYVRAN